MADANDAIDHEMHMNEVGLGGDLGTGDFNFNPMGTGIAGTAPKSDAISAQMDARAADQHAQQADTVVEKFHHREEMGQAKANRNDGGLNAPLLG